MKLDDLIPALTFASGGLFTLITTLASSFINDHRADARQERDHRRRVRRERAAAVETFYDAAQRVLNSNARRFDLQPGSLKAGALTSSVRLLAPELLDHSALISAFGSAAAAPVPYALLEWTDKVGESYLAAELGGFGEKERLQFERTLELARIALESFVADGRARKPWASDRS